MSAIEPALISGFPLFFLMTWIIIY